MNYYVSSMAIGLYGYQFPTDPFVFGTFGYSLPNIRDVSNTRVDAITFNDPSYAESSLSFRRAAKYG